MTALEQQPKGGPYVHVDLSFHLQQKSITTFDSTDDEGSSLGSSVKSGLRNSLHSSYDFLEIDAGEENSSSESDEEFGCDRSVSWRQCPKQSDSDWTMAVESVPDGTVVEYHVHKRKLAEGFKKSDFFVSLFNLSEEKKVENNGYSRTRIHTEAASLVPEMLDFIYSGTDDLEITTETAVGLRHLSEFFGIKALARRTVTFIFEDICIDNVQVYLLGAMRFDDLQTQKLCAQICAKNVDHIDPHSDLLTEMDPSFLLDIISCQQAERERVSSHMSKLVAVFCDLCRDIDGGVFEELTTVEYIPIVSEDCALDLMLLEDQLVEEARDENRGLTHLQKRCVLALTPHMNHKNSSSNAKELKDLKKKMDLLPKKVLIELLYRSLCINSS